MYDAAPLSRQVWEAQTGEVKEKWHESETIRYGAFASSGDCIVTATEMGTIRVSEGVSSECTYAKFVHVFVHVSMSVCVCVSVCYI